VILFRVLGIDLGKSGGLALSDHKELLQMEIMPEHPSELVDLIQSWDVTHVYMEKPFAMPGKSSAMSMLSFGIHCGIVQGIVQALRIPLRIVLPQEWSKSMCSGAKGKTTKDRSKEVALRLFPKMSFLASPKSRVIHLGLVESALISEFARRELLGMGMK
jgi:crossover junction endodeoxyribonuclease RuvC